MKWTICVVALLVSSISTAAQPENKVVRLGSTTSVKASGLLVLLVPAFERDTGYRLQTDAVGSGKALQLAREGRYDVLIVHAPAAEQKLIDQGYADRRTPFMRNSFLIVGPPQDPAHIKGTNDAREALRRIEATKSLFISRADDSGTHQKELALWKASGIEPLGSWYYEAGMPMDAVLKLANERQGYTLIDNGTWLANLKTSRLSALVEDLEHLGNTYSIVTMSRKQLPQLNHAGAAAFSKWLLSAKGNSIIRGMIVEGEPLFSLISP